MRSRSEHAAKIGTKEWAWGGLAIAILLALSSLPIVAGYAAQTPQAIFAGGVFDRQDFAVHLGAMQLGARGEWAYRFLFTTEDIAPGYTKLGYLVLGKVAGLLGMEMAMFYQASRLLLGAGALIAVYRYMASTFLGVGLRRTAFLLASTASGLGWMMLILNWMPDPEVPPADLWLIDFYLFYSLSTFPHFSAVIALMIVQGMGYLRFLERGRLRHWMTAAIAGLLMMPIQPFSVALGDLLAAGAVMASWRHRGRVRWGDLGPLVAMVAIQIPYLLYHLWLFRASPGWKAFAAQNIVLSPSPLYLLLGMGLLAPLAAWGGLWAWRRRNRAGMVSLVWLLGSLALSYSPTAIQRRFTLGLTIPLGALATLGLAYGLLPRLRGAWPRWARDRRRAILAVTVAAALPTSLYLAIGGAIFVLQRPAELFDPPAVIEAIEWLGEHAEPGAAVMASARSGWLIPPETALRTYLGHPFETLSYDAKRVETQSFFREDGMTAAERGELLRSCGCDWVLVGPYERDLGANEPLAMPETLRASYRRGGVTIYGKGSAE